MERTNGGANKLCVLKIQHRPACSLTGRIPAENLLGIGTLGLPEGLGDLYGECAVNRALVDQCILSGPAGDRAMQDLVDSSAQSVWGGSSEVMRDVIGRRLANLL